MANLDEACCSEEMAIPPSLMRLCEHVLASLLNRDLGFWKQVQGLPLDVIHGVLLCLPPLTLLSLSNQHVSISRSHNEGGNWSSAEMPSARGDVFELVSSSSSQAGRWKGDNRRNDNTRCCKRKRDYTGRGGELDSSTLDIGIPLAWKLLYRNRWPRRSRQSPSSEYGDSDCDKGEDNVDADWQQLYWEAHLQECLNAAAAQASVSSYECQIGDIMLPSDLVNKLSSSGREDNELSTLRGNCTHFAHYARKLRLQSVLCTPELVVLLKEARLRSISIYNVRIRSDLTGLCQLLAHSIPTLQRLEFYHSKFSGSTLNKIGRAMSPADTEHRLQHFALISSRIFDQTDLFLVKPPDFLHFLCAARWLRSLRLWDNSLEQENVVFIMNIIFHLSKNFSFLHLVDNELGELFTRLLANTLVSSNNCNLEAPPGLHRLTVLDLRSNMLDGEAVRSLAMCLKEMPKLEHLNLSDNPLEDSGIEGLVPYFKALCNGTSSLTILSLATCRMTASGATALLDALSLSQITIRRLSIASNHLGSSVSTSLAKFLRKCALEALDISDIGLGPTGCSIELEEAMISNKTILQFDISKNRISAPGAAMLASVIAAGCSAFTSINASANLLSVDSITSIATALQSQSYRQSAETILSLDLRENPGSFLCKLAGIYDNIGGCAVLLSDSSNESQPVFHDDDP